jgi:hypothetical protein
MLREKKAQDLRFIEYEFEADDYQVRQRRRIIADCERLLYGD